MCTTMPKSFPHGFTTFTNFCDRHTSETYLYFQLGASSTEVAGGLTDLEHRVAHRLTEGKVWLWCTDNDLAFEGPKVADVADKLIHQHERRPPGKKESNSVAVIVFTESGGVTGSPGFKQRLFVKFHHSFD